MKRAYFVLAPREMSPARVKQLLRELLPRRPVVFGVALEEYVAGFEGQPQFRTLQVDAVKGIAEKSAGRVTLLPYKQKDVVSVIKQLDFDRAIVVNGSHHRSFHLRPEYQAILDKGATIKYVSPFTDENEARAAVCSSATTCDQRGAALATEPRNDGREGSVSQKNLTATLAHEAARSFATDFQTAAAVVKDGRFLSLEHNRVLPYETAAWHHGSIREKLKLGAGDSSHYDTVHAETLALIKAGAAARGAELYCVTFPCPHCARNIVAAGIKKVYYQLDYGDDYGYNLFKEAGVEYERS